MVGGDGVSKRRKFCIFLQSFRQKSLETKRSIKFFSTKILDLQHSQRFAIAIFSIVSYPTPLKENNLKFMPHFFYSIFTFEKKNFKKNLSLNWFVRFFPSTLKFSEGWSFARKFNMRFYQGFHLKKKSPRRSRILHAFNDYFATKINFVFSFFVTLKIGIVSL